MYFICFPSIQTDKISDWFWPINLVVTFFFPTISLQMWVTLTANLNIFYFVMVFQFF